MKEKCKQNLNIFFVDTFNKILALEEKTLTLSGITNVSVKELHIIEAVNSLKKTDENTMSKIALRLDITVGALTTGINALVRKGYLERYSHENDRRIVMINLTKDGQQANARHDEFHQNMINGVAELLDDEQLTTLTISLNKLSEFFKNK